MIKIEEQYLSSNNFDKLDHHVYSCFKKFDQAVSTIELKRYFNFNPSIQSRTTQY